MACWRLSRPSTTWPFPPERHVQDRCVLPFRSLRRPAFRHSRTITCEPALERRSTDAQRQLQSVRGARSATMARKRGRRRSQRLSTGHGRSGDRNLVDFSFDTGLTYEGPFGREDDTIGSGFAYTRIGGAARSLDADTTATTPAYPVRSRETLLEVSYQFQVTRRWQLQPDFQYIFNRAAAFLTPPPPRGGSAMPQCSG